MADQISLVNRALLGIGARAQVSSFTEGSTASDAAAILFQPTFEQLGRAAHWNCLRNQATLTLVKAAQGTPENPQGTTLPLPPQPWLYEYLYPVDCLKIRYLLPTFLPPSASGVGLTTVNNVAQSFYPTNGGQIPYAVNYDTDPSGNPRIGILTNLSAAQAVYTVNQANPQVWDAQFQAAFVASLGAFLVPALSLHMQLMGVMIKMAEAAIAQARATDGNESVISQNREAEWIIARGGGQGRRGGLGFASPYENMAWPVWSGG